MGETFPFGPHAKDDDKGMNLGWKGWTKRKNLWKKTHGLINLSVDEGNNPFKLGGGGGGGKTPKVKKKKQ
jgi:hypothetical protein